MKINKEMSDAIDYELTKGSKDRPWPVYDIAEGISIAKVMNRFPDGMYIRPIVGNPDSGPRQTWRVWSNGTKERII